MATAWRLPTKQEGRVRFKSEGRVNEKGERALRVFPQLSLKFEVLHMIDIDCCVGQIISSVLTLSLALRIVIYPSSRT